MPIFHYRACNDKQEIISGSLEAREKMSVANNLIQKGLTPISITVEKKVFSLSQLLSLEISKEKVKTDELIMFCRQMYSLTKAGVPLLESLRKLAETTRGKRLRLSLLELETEIAQGQSFSDSLAKLPDVFPTIFVSVVKAGEQSGQMEIAFERLAAHFELDAKTKKKVTSATRYPLMVIGVLVVAFGVINFMVVPAFADMFSQFQQDLPIVTRALMGMSNFLIGNWLILLVLLGIIIFAVRFYLKLPSGRYSWDKAKLNMPLFGPIIYRVIIARFARIFDMLVKSGVPIVDSINLVSAVLGNTYMIQSIQHMGKSVEGGDSLTKAAKEADVFSPIALQMLSVGEEAGMLNDMLSEIADYYEREVDYDLDRLGDLIEPILLAVLGIMVLLIALGVFLPMWNMTSFLS